MRLPTNATLLLLATIGTSLLFEANAHATCGSTSTEPEIDYWFAHGGYFDDFVQWERDALALNICNWNGVCSGLKGPDATYRGYFDPNNTFFEYTKHWNATHLISYGLIHSPSEGFFIPSFHDGQADYLEVARARDSEEWHDSLEHYASDDIGSPPSITFGRFDVGGLFEDDALTTTCALYSDIIRGGFNIFATPSRRGSDYVHEGWHSWMQEHGWQQDHYSASPNGLCSIPGTNCDYYYAHPKSDFPPGTLWESDGTTLTHMHSVYQAQFEYECDIADSGATYIPTSVVLAAINEAGLLGSQQFINAVPFTCGGPVPIPPSSPPPGRPNTAFCGANSDCASDCCLPGGTGPITSFGPVLRCAPAGSCIR
jgi:hypothetical protein